MPAFTAHDGTSLAYHLRGEGQPLVCLPGGPMRDPVYLGDLGGLSDHRQLVLLDLRGTGESAVPEDTTSYRCDRQVADVEALRQHLDLDRIALLGHSAGVNLAVMYAARHPERVSRLVLVTPSTKAVGIETTGDMRREVARVRVREPWFPPAFAALERIIAGESTQDGWEAIAPFSYGRWDAEAQEHHASQTTQRNEEAAAGFAAAGAFDPDATRAALATFGSPVLLLAGAVDLGAVPSVVMDYGELFPDATVVVQAEAGHFPWLDDPDRFTEVVAGFLG